MACQFVVAVEVAALDCYAYEVAWLNGLLVGAEGTEGQDAFGFVADVEEDGVGGDGDDGRINLL